MKDDSFDQMDESLMKDFKKLRDRKVPDSILRGFGESVEKRILEEGRPVFHFGNGTVILSATFILLIVLGAVWQWSKPAVIVPGSVKMVAENQAVLETSDIDSDVAVLKALGEWGEDDEAAIGIPVENVFAEFAEFDLDTGDNGMMVGRNTAVSVR